MRLDRWTKVEFNEKFFNLKFLSRHSILKYQEFRKTAGLNRACIGTLENLYPRYNLFSETSGIFSVIRTSIPIANNSSQKHASSLVSLKFIFRFAISISLSVFLLSFVVRFYQETRMVEKYPDKKISFHRTMSFVHI